jgi:hypothetical protein
MMYEKSVDVGLVTRTMMSVLWWRGRILNWIHGHHRHGHTHVCYRRRFFRLLFDLYMVYTMHLLWPLCVYQGMRVLVLTTTDHARMGGREGIKRERAIKKKPQ